MGVGDPPEQVVVVTGTGGMGMAIARRLGGGHQLVLADRIPEVLRAAAETLRGEGHHVHERPTDVSDPDAVTVLAETAAELGPLASVVHTAGVSPTQATSEQIVQVDVVGTARLLDAFAARVGRGTAGVCIASMAGTMFQGVLPTEVERALAATPTDELADLEVLDPSSMDPGHAYAVAKRANQLRVAAASVAWGERGARVNSISPGVISTPMGQQELASESGDMMRAMVESSATKRLGTPDDIAAAVAFLVGPEASFITGTDLLVDGGVVAAMRNPPAAD